MNRQELGKRLKEIRESRGISKRSVYKEIMNNTQLDAIEAGSANYTVDSLLIYLDRIKFDLDDVFKIK